MPPLTGDDGTPSGFAPAVPFGVWGDAGTALPFGPGGGNGVIGSSLNSSGVAGFTLANHDRAAGAFGMGPWVGVAGIVTGATTAPAPRVGVYGSGSDGRRLGGVGVLGESDTRTGVSGSSRSGSGVGGGSNTGVGVVGNSQSAAGVLGVSAQNVGVFGISNGTGVIGWGGSQAGLFIGDVHITGSLSKGGGGFEIDHPLDPANRYLRHSFVESPEMKNLYDGIAVCDAKGRAVVTLPKWFETLNRDFRYQLTPIGGPAPDLHVAAGVRRGRFTIGGGVRGRKVSWQVTGVRKDAWANAHRLTVDEKKPAADRGRYLHPEVHGRRRQRTAAHARFDEQARRRLAGGEAMDAGGTD